MGRTIVAVLDAPRNLGCGQAQGGQSPYGRAILGTCRERRGAAPAQAARISTFVSTAPLMSLSPRPSEGPVYGGSLEIGTWLDRTFSISGSLFNANYGRSAVTAGGSGPTSACGWHSLAAAKMRPGSAGGFADRRRLHDIEYTRQGRADARRRTRAAAVAARGIGLQFRHSVSAGAVQRHLVEVRVLASLNGPAAKERREPGLAVREFSHQHRLVTRPLRRSSPP